MASETHPRQSASRDSGVDLRGAATLWMADGRAQGWSPRTLDSRGRALERFAWWMEHVAGLSPALHELSPSVMRRFLTYLREPRPGGRWGTGSHSGKRDIRPATVQTCYRILRAFLNLSVAEKLLEDTPLRNVKAPRVPNDQVLPFSPEQVQWLLNGARRGIFSERDVLIVLLLVDTGMRVSELCGLTVGDVNRASGELVVLGKGGQRRRVYMGVAARRALWRYLELEGRTGWE